MSGTRISLAERVSEFVAAHPGLLLEEIARGVQARTADVRDVLLGEGFSSSLRLAYPSDRARVYSTAANTTDGPGRAKKPSQCDRVSSVLRDGGWHTAAEIHHRCGFMRLNSRVAELRRRGLVIVCEHVKGAGTGPSAYRYRQIGTREEAAPDARDSLPVGLPAVSSRAQAADEQLTFGAAA